MILTPDLLAECVSVARRIQQTMEYDAFSSRGRKTVMERLCRWLPEQQRQDLAQSDDDVIAQWTSLMIDGAGCIRGNAAGLLAGLRESLRTGKRISCMPTIAEVRTMLSAGGRAMKLLQPPWPLPEPVVQPTDGGARYGPSPELMTAVRNEYRHLMMRRRQTSSHRTHIDLFQYALSNEVLDVMRTWADLPDARNLWWGRICRELQIPHLTVASLGFSERWITAKVRNRVQQRHDVEAMAAGISGAPPRPEQAGFRDGLLRVYKGRCAMSGVTEDLEAAHIIQEAVSHDFNLNNGVLLSADLHVDFDRYRFTITTCYRVAVRDRDGPLGAYHNVMINLPDDPAERPNLDRLRWHNHRCRRWLSQ